MKLWWRRSAIAWALVAASVTTAAAGEWKAEAELGIVTTSGNTDTESVNGRIKADYRLDGWSHSGQVETVTNANAGTTTAERYFLAAKSRYRYTTRSYLFGRLSYDDDRFSGYDYRATEVVGYGRSVLQRDDLVLHLEIGLGARQSRLDGTGGTDREPLVLGAADLKWVASESAEVTEDLTVESGEDATISKSVTALKARIGDRSALKFSVTVKYTDHVPAGIARRDTQTATTLVFSF